MGKNCLKKKIKGFKIVLALLQARKVIFALRTVLDIEQSK
jgi:hypothetical protein